jgi:hypothetical protein
MAPSRQHPDKPKSFVLKVYDSAASNIVKYSYGKFIDDFNKTKLDAHSNVVPGDTLADALLAGKLNAYFMSVGLYRKFCKLVAEKSGEDQIDCIEAVEYILVNECGETRLVPSLTRMGGETILVLDVRPL